MKCPVCSENNWKNVDHMRLKKVGMSMCLGCGFVSYPSKYKTEEEIKEYYRKNYRPGPQAHNLFTGERKLQYHNHFLAPIFEEWKLAGHEEPVVGEIGAAYGLLLNWIKQQFPKADVVGTELTESFRRVAYHEYGIKLVEDFDYTKKYDLIISYHVLEHQTEPDKKLKEYAACLKRGGIFYLSCPVWFTEAANSAMPGFDIESYWAEDHINSWAPEHLEYIIEKAGLSIIHRDDTVYGFTYILKRSEKDAEKKTFDHKKYLDAGERLFQAWTYLQENQTELALETYKNMPCAWVAHYEFNRAKFHKDIPALDAYLKEAIKNCPNSCDVYVFAGDVLARYERYDEAREMFHEALKRKPGAPTILMAIANCYRMRALKEKDPTLKDKMLRESINLNRMVMSLSTEFLPQAISWSYHDQSHLPVPQ
jgi:2-polyprenyl-3-methyl-5-hydroxy-6-metoxy-1,4-benzoquinol methylase